MTKEEKIMAYLPYGVKYLYPYRKGYGLFNDDREASVEVMTAVNVLTICKSKGDQKLILRPLPIIDNRGLDAQLYDTNYIYIISLINQHYDVFGLIKSGDAMDIKDLKADNKKTTNG